MIKTMRRSLRLSIVGIAALVPFLTFAQGNEYISLTGFEGFAELGNSPNIEVFFNNLYKLCIGIAATIAVFQIIRAGVIYMGGDSFTEKKEAKSLIGASLVGLLLVLSPVIVFSIINPDILELKLDLSSLKTAPPAPPTNDLGQEDRCENNVSGCGIAPDPTAPGCNVKYENNQLIGTDNKSIACCSSQDSTFYGQKFMDCEPQSRTNPDQSGFASYCGCDIKIGALTYTEYVYQEVRANSVYKSEDRGVTPKYTTHYKEYADMCTASGGELKTSNESFLGAYRDCTIEKDNLTSEKTLTPGHDDGSWFTQYRCRDKSVQCVEKD